MIWGQPAKQMESRARAYPISQQCCLMGGPQSKSYGASTLWLQEDITMQVSCG